MGGGDSLEDAKSRIDFKGLGQAVDGAVGEARVADAQHLQVRVLFQRLKQPGTPPHQTD